MLRRRAEEVPQKDIDICPLECLERRDTAGAGNLHLREGEQTLLQRYYRWQFRPHSTMPPTGLKQTRDIADAYHMAMLLQSATRVLCISSMRTCCPMEMKSLPHACKMC